MQKNGKTILSSSRTSPQLPARHPISPRMGAHVVYSTTHALVFRSMATEQAVKAHATLSPPLPALTQTLANSAATRAVPSATPFTPAPLPASMPAPEKLPEKINDITYNLMELKLSSQIDLFPYVTQDPSLVLQLLSLQSSKDEACSSAARFHKTALRSKKDYIASLISSRYPREKTRYCYFLHDLLCGNTPNKKYSSLEKMKLTKIFFPELHAIVIKNKSVNRWFRKQFYKLDQQRKNRVPGTRAPNSGLGFEIYELFFTVLCYVKIDLTQLIENLSRDTFNQLFTTKTATILQIDQISDTAKAALFQSVKQKLDDLRSFTVLARLLPGCIIDPYLGFSIPPSPQQQPNHSLQQAINSPPISNHRPA